MDTTGICSNKVALDDVIRDELPTDPSKEDLLPVPPLFGTDDYWSDGDEDFPSYEGETRAPDAGLSLVESFPVEDRRGDREGATHEEPEEELPAPAEGQAT